MLTSLRIKNFKGWKDTGEIRLAPLTVIFGANSAGKSSLGHLLLALKQTAKSTDNKRSLHLGDDKSMIDLGTYRECIHNHDISQPLSFSITWDLPTNLEVHNVIDDQVYTGDNLTLAVEFTADKNEQPRVRSLEYVLKKENKLSLTTKFHYSEKGKPEIETSPLKLVRTMGRGWPLEEPLKFYRLSDQSRAKFQNADFMIDLALQTEKLFSSIQYLGPLREYPKRTYLWSGDAPENVGQKGELTIAALLAAVSKERKLNRSENKRNYSFDEFIAKWLKDLGVIHDFSVKPVAEGRKEYEVLLKTHPKSSEVKITDVGFGISQVLPALVQAFYCEPHSTVWMEQPEIHLHPQVQSNLADVFISAIHSREDGKERNVQLIVESHSEHFLNRLQRRIAEGVVPVEDVAVYFCRKSGERTELEPLRLNMFGEIENWPENFFGDEMDDISARALAAIAKQKNLIRDKPE
ncbi:MAG: DUF3696 domain-containing protein [Sphaerochaeta sp.]|nr:DUF3696 domain-containing protein [Sphaerochaeta sp.]